MAYRYGARKLKSAAAILLLVSACGEKAVTPEVVLELAECVKIDEGNYAFQNGKFIRVGAPAPKIIERVIVEKAERAWNERVEAAFPGMGYAFMGLNVRRNIATLIGVAPDPKTKDAAFEAGKAAVLATPEGAGLNVVDGISVEGGEAGVGAALASLEDAPSLASCQAAFVQTMAGRNVQFRIGSAVILPASAQLLDAVSGVASLCSSYKIEIAGHTDSVGDDAKNLILSQGRADSVREYLATRGVDISQIEAIGYGETRPVDTSGTITGNALNRRTEFTVRAR